MKKDFRLYNLILPPFMLIMFTPPWILISLIGNFLIDSLLLIIFFALFFKRVYGKLYIKTIFKVFGLGYASDFIGVLFLMIPFFLPSSLTKNWNDGIFMFMGIALASIFIFLFDYFISFRNCGFTKIQRIVSSIAFAVITAPYTFLLPESLFY